MGQAGENKTVMEIDRLLLRISAVKAEIQQLKRLKIMLLKNAKQTVQ
jgi:hypothetical protein